MPSIRAKKPSRMPFAVLALVREHGVQVETIAALMFVNQAMCLVLAPLAGRLVDRVGERPVLTGYFAGVGVIFVLYATMGYRFPFYCGAGIALVSMAIAQFVPARSEVDSPERSSDTRKGGYRTPARS